MENVLFHVTGRFTRADRIGRVPEGERGNFHFNGDVTGEINGTLDGCDYALITEGDVYNIHIHELLTTAEGELISFERTGQSLPHEEEGFLNTLGKGMARTASERLAWLNEAELVWGARINRATFEYTAWVKKA